MKKFFLRIFLLLFLASLGYALFLTAPFGLFLYSFQNLSESEDAFALELHPLSGLVVLENNSPADAGNASSQTLTYALSDETLERMLSAYLLGQRIPGVVLDSLNVLIAPEMLSLEISWKCTLFGYRFYENTVFSEWQLRIAQNGEVKRIEITPKELHNNHLYSVNLADFWAFAPWIDSPDGWFALNSSSPLNIQELILQDGAISLTLGAAAQTLQ